jgi:hypothetical protein
MFDVQNAEFVALFRACESKNFNKEVGDLFKRPGTQATADGPCENIARCNQNQTVPRCKECLGFSAEVYAMQRSISFMQRVFWIKDSRKVSVY